jgi:bacterioferritin-associated ferredoxin
VIICHCAVVSDRLVIQAVDSGARTLAQVCRATDAGQDCGACVFNVRRVITEYHSAQETNWDSCASSPKRARVAQLV